MPEPAFTDDETRILRLMIRDYRQDEAVSKYLARRWKYLVAFIGFVMAVTMTAAAVETLVRTAMGG